LTPVPRWRFFWTTAVGILPGAIAFTAAGAGVSWLATRLPAVMWWVAGLLGLFVVCGGAWNWMSRRISGSGR